MPIQKKRCFCLLDFFDFQSMVRKIPKEKINIPPTTKSKTSQLKSDIVNVRTNGISKTAKVVNRTLINNRIWF